MRRLDIAATVKSGSRRPPAAIVARLAVAASAEMPAAVRSRLLVLTDIEAHPDDMESLVRLLLTRTNSTSRA